MNSISIPIVHPAFEKLKKSGTILHFTAGVFILVHAISHISMKQTEPLYFWCLLVIALDIFILVFAGRQICTQLPAVNLLFRFIEVIFFVGIGTTMLMRAQYAAGFLHFGLSIAYSYLFYCELKLKGGEWLGIHHTGLSIPGIPSNHFLLWSKINSVHARYDHIAIETSDHKKLEFNLRRNLDFEDMEHVNAFCHHYLGN